MRGSGVSLVETLRAKRRLIGTLLSVRSADTAEALALAGFDWLFIDMEHSVIDIATAQQMIQAVAGRSFTVIRIADHAPEHFKKSLDAGCDGIIVPMVNSREEAERAVQLAKYPPVGSRGVGIGRAHGFGHSFSEYVANANARVALILQIEHIDAVEHIEEILSVPGFDAIFIGPYDLSGSLNLLGKTSAPEVVAAIENVRRAAKQAGIPFGSFSMTVEGARAEAEAGGQLIVIGTDITFMTGAAKAALEKLAASF
jgi:2-keto-3-deoxy-L-rhamnonate aldolase RhmA